jgi:hypothetical protein
MHETQRHIKATEAMRFSVPTGRPRRSRKQQENIMASFKTLAALALLSVTTSTPTFSTTLQRGNQVMTTFRQELSEPELAAIPGASTTIRRTLSIVLMPIEANVRRQQQEALASVSQTLFGKCIRGAARDGNALQARR